MKLKLLLTILLPLALTGCPLSDLDGDGIPDVFDTKDDRPGAGELNGVDYNGNQFVTPTPTPVASPQASPAPSPIAAPAILQDPQSTSAPFGSSVTLSVNAIGSSLQYQWYEGAAGVTSAPVGTNSSSFSTGNLTSSTSYWVKVSNSGGNVNSASAQITVLNQAPTITTQPVNQELLLGETATFSLVASGQNLTYQWYNGFPPNTDSPIDGANSAIYTTPPVTTSTQRLWAQVSNNGGSALSRGVITFVITAPEIIVQPASQTVDEGTSTRLEVEVERPIFPGDISFSPTPPTYQWYEGESGDESAPISGATASSFETGALTSTTNYWVKITNAAGSSDSETATITVTPAP